MTIPFFKVNFGEEEKKAISDVIDSGWIVMGEKTKEFEENFSEYVGSKYAVFVDSGTAALDLSLKWHLNKKNISKGEIVGVPSLTFASSAEVIVNNELIPEFLDVSPFDLCINGFYSLPLIKVHLMGNKTHAYSSKFSIEDSAHRIEKRQCEKNNNLVCFSFYATKNLTTINGGMIAVNDKDIYEWLKLARDHGITEGTAERYKDGKWEYDIKFVGWREKSDDVRAAIGLVQLAKIDEMNEKRFKIVSQYNRLLGLERKGLHIYSILTSNRAEMVNFLLKKGIQTAVHFLPVHKMSAYKVYSNNCQLPNTDYLGERLVSLPLYPQLEKEEVSYIVEQVKESKLFIQK